MEILTQSAQESQKIGESLGAYLKKQTSDKAHILLLYGDLGSGKTTFVQGVARGLGISERIVSPTFILMREYRIDEARSFYHIDLYRTLRSQDSEALGLGELVKDKENIIAIEWPERLAEQKPPNAMEIWFEQVGEEKRKLVFKNFPEIVLSSSPL